MKRLLPVTFVLLAMALLVSGCSSKSGKSSAVSLNVALAAISVSDVKVQNLAADLKAGLPQYNDGTKSMRVTGVSTGDPKTDAEVFMAGSTRIASMFASHEIELWICDAGSATRYAEGGKSYVALSTLFTNEEIGAFKGTPIKIAVTDAEGKETGAYSEPCGIDLSQNATVTALTGISDPRMFIIAGSSNMDAAKAAFRYIATK